MIGIGAAGLFQGFPVSTSGSRITVAERSGARTSSPGHRAAVIILMIVLVPGHFFPAIESVVAAFRPETGAEWAASQAPADRTGSGRQG
jgi:hypothetical protein